MNPLMKHRYQSWLVPYAEGALDERRRAKLEARLARDPALAAEAEAVRRTTRHLRESAQNEKGPDGTAATAPVSELWPGIEARLRPSRQAPSRPWLWAGGLCAAASLAGATLWGPLRTPHTTLPQPGAAPGQKVAENSPSLGASPAKTYRKGHPGKRATNYGKPLKHPVRVKHGTPVSRPDPADLLADRPAPAPTGVDSPNAPDAVPTSTGHFRLTAGERDLTPGTSDQGDKPGTTPMPNDGNAPAKTGEALGDGPRAETPSRPGRRQRRHRHYRRRHSADKAAPAQATPVLPPDTIPQADPAPKIPKHRPDID